MSLTERKHFHQTGGHSKNCCPLEGGMGAPLLAVFLVQTAKAVGSWNSGLENSFTLNFVSNILVILPVCVLCWTVISSLSCGFGFIFSFVIPSKVAGWRALNMSCIPDDSEYTLCVGLHARLTKHVDAIKLIPKPVSGLPHTPRAIQPMTSNGQPILERRCKPELHQCIIVQL